MKFEPDPRYTSIKSRLELLPSASLEHFLAYSRLVVYDELNYRPEDDAYCPLAIMLNIENKLKQNDLEPNQDVVLKCLKEHEVFGTVKGVEGKFYKDNREEDIKNLCREILDERKSIELRNEL